MTAGRSSISIKKDWSTPPKYVSAIKKVFNGIIYLDPCSNKYSIVKAKVNFRLPKTDGLKKQWNYKTIYVNPPYGRDKERGTTIKQWIKKCREAHTDFGAEVISLIPVATNTSHWKEYIWNGASSICFLYDTRLKFLEDGVESIKGAPMACAMVYWGNDNKKFNDVFQKYGKVIKL